MERRMIPSEKAVPQRTVARRTTARSPATNLEFWFWVALLVIQMQPMDVMISGYDPSFPLTSDSANHIGNYIRETISLGVIGYLIKEYAVSRRFLVVAWPLLAFLAYAVVISPVAGDPSVALKYLTGTIVPMLIVPIAMATRMRPIAFVSAWTYALTGLCILSLFAAVLLPQYGVVRLSQFPGIGSPGNWRGAFPTKNVLGHASAITFALLIIFREQIVPNRAILYPGIAASLICLGFSASSTGYVIAAALPAFYYSLLSPRSELMRFISTCSATVVTIVFLAFHDEIIAFSLAAIGKKPNLTGRAAIWQAVGSMIPSAGLLGHGMGYTTTKEFMAMLISSFGVPYIHNEYLDLVINYGIVGALLFIAVVIFALVQGFFAKVADQSSVAKRVAVVMLGGWALSGMTETTSGTMLAFVFVPLCALYLLRTDRRAPARRNVARTVVPTGNP